MAGLIINIDEALKQRSTYNVLREPLHEMMKKSVEAFEKDNPIDKIFARNSIGTFQETYVSSIGFAHAFAETSDYSVGPIFNTAEGFSATYRTRTFQGGFIITRQTLEDGQYGKAKDDASQFTKRWLGDKVEYAMAAIQSGFGETVKWGSAANGGVSKLRLQSADTVDGELDSQKNPLFTNKHTLVKRDDVEYDLTTAKTTLETVTDLQSNKFYVDINLAGSDAGKIAKLADAINQVITYMENLHDDNNKIAGLQGAKTIVSANDARIKASLKTALSAEMFMQGESKFDNPAYDRATSDYTPYLNVLPAFANGRGILIIDKAYNSENHGLEVTERVPFTLDVFDHREAPQGVKYEGRERMDINVASWRGIAYLYIGTPAGASGKWDDVSTFTKVTPGETIVKPVTVVNAEDFA